MKKLIVYFALAYLISWVLWLPLILPKFGINVLPILPKYHHYLGSFGPMIAAFIVKYIYDGWKGVKDLLKRMAQWKVNWIWYVVVLVIPVLLVIAAGYADELINQQPFSMKGFSTNNEFPQFGVVSYFLLNFFTFGIGEETGWRGYAFAKKIFCININFNLNYWVGLLAYSGIYLSPLIQPNECGGYCRFFYEFADGGHCTHLVV
jgi:uncharacterized protein